LEGPLKEKVKILQVDLDDAIQLDVFETADRLLKEETSKGGKEREVAEQLKKHMDENYGKHWHIIVGASFGSQVSALSNGFLYFYLDDVAILCFRTN